MDNGLWPFYVEKKHSAVSTLVEFDSNNKLTITMTSEKNVPIVVGCIAMPIGVYLGDPNFVKAVEMLTAYFYK